MSVNRDLFYRLASNVPKERLQTASLLISQFAASNDNEERSYVLKRLINGLASNRDSARIGFSIVLTELISIIIPQNYTLSEPCNKTDVNLIDFSNYSPSQFIVDLINILDSQIKNKTKGKNLRSYLFGVLFGLQCLINSKVLLPKGESEIDYFALKSIVSNLLILARTKSWISEISHFTIANLLKSHNLASDEILTPFVLESLDKVGTLLTSDGLLVYLQIPIDLRSHLADLSNISNSWKHGDPLLKGNGDLLSNALKNTNSIVPNENKDDDDDDDNDDVDDNDNNDNENKKKNSKVKNSNGIQKSSWSSQIHPVWIPLFSEVIHFNDSLTLNPSKKRKTVKSKNEKNHHSDLERISFSSFYSLFQSIYFTPNTSPEKKYSGLQIVELLVSSDQINVPENYLPQIFSGPTSRVIIDHVSKKDRVLNSIATRLLSTTVYKALNNNRRLSTIKAFEYQSVFFDRLTHTKSVQGLLVNVETPTEWIEITEWLLVSDDDLSNSISNGKKQKLSEREIVDIKIWVIDSLFTMIKSSKNLLTSVLNGANNKQNKIAAVDDEEKEKFIDLIKSYLKYLVEIVFLNKNISVEGESSDKILSSAKERFNSVLGLLIDYTSEETIDWTSFVVNFISDNESSLKSPLQGELNEIKVWSIDTLKSLKNTNNENDISKSLELLIAMALLELFSGDTESAGVLMDLKNVYNDSYKINQISEGNESLLADETQYYDAPSHVQDDDQSHDHEEESVDPVLDTLIDLLLSYITQKSTLKKNIATKIWETLLELGVGEIQLSRLTEILLTRENKKGMENLFQVGVEDFEGDSDDDDSDDENSGEAKNILDDLSDKEDNDEKSLNSKSESESESGSESESDSGDNDDSDDENVKDKLEEVENTTSAALAKVLQTTNLKQMENNDDDSDDDSDDSDISEQSMSDEQMFALDNQLSAIFKQRRDALTNIGGSSDPNKRTGNERKMEAQDARDLMALVKNRVLDLLELYVNREPYKGTKSCLLISMACLQTIELTLDKVVQNKARRVVKDSCAVAFSVDSDDVYEWLIENLNQLFQMASNSKFQLLDQGISQVIIFIGKCASVNGGFNDKLTKIVDGLKNAANDKENKMDVQILRDFLGWLKSKFDKNELPVDIETEFSQLIKDRSVIKSKRNGKNSKGKNKKKGKN